MSDRISARCSGCSATLGLPLYTAGKRIRCPKCQAVVDVPLDAELLGAGPDPQRKKNSESPPKASPQRERPPQREQSPRVTESRRGSSASRAEPSEVQKPRASRDDDASAAGKRRSSGSSSAERADARGAQPSRTGGRQSPQRSESSKKRPTADQTEDSYGNELDFIADYGHSSDYETSYEAPTLPPRQKAGSRRSRSTESSGSYGADVDESVSGQVLIGIAMMVGAVVWFVCGFYFLGYIFYYPPVMFCLGAAACYRAISEKLFGKKEEIPLTTGERILRHAVWIPVFPIMSLVGAVILGILKVEMGIAWLFGCVFGAVSAFAAVRASRAIFRMITKRGAS